MSWRGPPGCDWSPSRTGATCFDLPLADVSAPPLHLIERVAPGVRMLPLDLPRRFTASGGIGHNVELLVTRADGGDRFTRSLAVIPVLAAGEHARSELLGEAGVEATSRLWRPGG